MRVLLLVITVFLGSVPGLHCFGMGVSTDADRRVSSGTTTESNIAIWTSNLAVAEISQIAQSDIKQQLPGVNGDVANAIVGWLAGALQSELEGDISSLFGATSPVNSSTQLLQEIVEELGQLVNAFSSFEAEFEKAISETEFEQLVTPPNTLVEQHINPQFASYQNLAQQIGQCYKQYGSNSKSCTQGLINNPPAPANNVLFYPEQVISGIQPATIANALIAGYPTPMVYLWQTINNNQRQATIQQPTQGSMVLFDDSQFYQQMNQFYAYWLGKQFKAMTLLAEAYNFKASLATSSADTFHKLAVNAVQQTYESLYPQLDMLGSPVSDEQVIIDNRSGLIWARQGITVTTVEEAYHYLDTLTLGGHSDWRLPTQAELTAAFGSIPSSGVLNELQTLTSYLNQAGFSLPGDNPILAFLWLQEHGQTFGEPGTPGYCTISAGTYLGGYALTQLTAKAVQSCNYPVLPEVTVLAVREARCAVNGIYRNCDRSWIASSFPPPQTPANTPLTISSLTDIVTPPKATQCNADSSWTQISNQICGSSADILMKSVSVAPGGSAIYAIGAKGNIWRRSGIESDNPEGDCWQLVSGKLYDLNNQPGISAAVTYYQTPNSEQNGQMVPPWDIRPIDISVGADDEVWMLTANFLPFRLMFPGDPLYAGKDGGEYWLRVSAGAESGTLLPGFISVKKSADTVAVQISQNITEITNTSGNTQLTPSGSFVRLGITSSNPLGTGWSPLVDDNWDVTHVAAVDDTFFYGIWPSTNLKVRRTQPTPDWVNITGPMDSNGAPIEMVEVSVGGDGSLWLLDNNGNAYLNAAPLAATPNQQTYQWQQKSSLPANIGGFQAISAGDKNNVWAVEGNSDRDWWRVFPNYLAQYFSLNDGIYGPAGYVYRCNNDTINIGGVNPSSKIEM